MSFITRDVTTPTNGWIVRTDYFWICENGDPTKALFFQGYSAQCNRMEAMVDRFIHTLYKDHPVPVSKVFIPIAYVPERR